MYEFVVLVEPGVVDISIIATNDLLCSKAIQAKLDPFGDSYHFITNTCEELVGYPALPRGGFFLVPLIAPFRIRSFYLQI